MADKKKTFGSLQPNIDDILAWNELSEDAFAPASVSEKENFIQDRKSVSYWADAWRRLRKNTVAMVAMVIVFLIALFAFIGPMFNAFRAVPPLAWIPLITLWFGIGEFPKVLIVIFGSLACIVVNVQAGLSTVEKTFLDVATVFNATPAQRLFNVAIPASLDAIFAGVRTSTSAAWMVVLAAEMLGANAGVGFLISRGMDSIDMPLVLTGMLAIGIVGALLAIITQFAERLICPWTRKKR